MASASFFYSTPKTGLVNVVNADGTTAKTIVTAASAAGAVASKVSALNVASTDTSSRIFIISKVRSGTPYPICAVTIPAGSGTDGTTATVNVFAAAIIPGLPVDNDGQAYINLQTGDTLTATLSTGSVTATKTVTFTAEFADG
jgi:hypothetical protein